MRSRKPDIQICYIQCVKYKERASKYRIEEGSFDITKPPPIRQLQDVHGGFGIVVDDFLAALIALGLNHLLFTFL